MDLEYEDGRVVRCRPSTSEFVVIDPTRSFGTPIIEQFGISTGMLYSEYSVFQDADYLAQIYEIDIALVEDAVKFEKKLDASLDGKGTI